MAFLIEHYAGAFPVWLAPVQAVIIPVSDQQIEYGRKLEAELKLVDIRVEIDDRPERMNQKIRQAQKEKIPCMLIVGNKEVADSTVSVRLRTGEQLPPQPISLFKERMQKTIFSKVKDFEL
jgi:threonyl-tRNA synthetase